MKRALLLLALAACPASQPGRSTTSAPAPSTGPTAKPRLVVLLVIDQWPEWSFEAKRSELTGGFGRMLAEGEWRVGRHPSAATTTAAGHALLGTGEPPSRSGIIGNEWWDRATEQHVTAIKGEDGTTSSRFLRVPGLGDVVATRAGAKAVAVALKIRAARLTLGHHGLAIAYDGKAGTWVSHGAPAPAWLATYAAAHPIAPAPWTPKDPARLAQLSGTIDAQPGEVGEKGFGPTFPHDPATTKHPTDAVYAQPHGNQMILDMAAAAVAGEQLGVDDKADLLVVSLSAHDYVAHGWGHESWEAWEMTLRLDEQLAAFLALLDDKVGRNQWAMVMTSDHGGSPLPERSDGGRIAVEELQRAANAAASTNLGTGTWIAPAANPYLYFTKDALAANPKELKNAMRKIVFALRSFPGLAIADRTDAYAGRCDERSGDARAICLSIDPERAGDFVVLPKAGWVIEEETERLATGHGSLHDYDRNVPVILLPFGRTQHAPQSAPTVEMSLADVAPLVASWLGVPAPASLNH